MTDRKHTKTVYVRDIPIGGNHPIVIQSMTNTKTENVKETVAQIHRLEQCGCEIIRLAVPTKEAAYALRSIKEEIQIPLVADIHFDYRLALLSMENGADKIRINPGNIGEAAKLREVVSLAKEKNIPIRVGVNAGSLEKSLMEKYGKATADALVESAQKNAELITNEGYDNIVISIKSSDVLLCKEAYKKLSVACDFPLHVGITESGTVWSGNIKSAIGLSLILSEGIGDTIRVSLTGDPVEEIRSAKLILKTLGLRQKGMELISCPTCGRTQIDLQTLANETERLIDAYDADLKVAVMGCVVNGPGEARDADIGICGGIGEGLIIKKGEVIKKVPEEALLSELKNQLEEILSTR